MATLGFEINDQTVGCVVHTNGIDTVAVCGGDGMPASDLSVAITPAGPVFGNAARCAMQAQPELPATTDLLCASSNSNHWYQDSCDKQWYAPELLQTLMSQIMSRARDITFQRHWSATVAVEAECRSLLDDWLTNSASMAECNIQAVVSRQAAIAAHWSTLHTAGQTVITLDWAPRQIHLGVFTCSGGTFKLLHTVSISDAGLIALEKTIAQALMPPATRHATPDTASELSIAAKKLWQQAIVAPSGVAKHECWVDGELTELILCQDHLREMVRPFCQRVKDELSRALVQLGLKATDADRVVLLGGPHAMLKTELVQHLELSPEVFVGLTGSAAIAEGAAILSALAPAKLNAIVQLDETLHACSNCQAKASVPVARLSECDIGLRIGNSARGKSMIYKLIDANTDLPASRSRTFRTSRPNQTRLVLDMVYVAPATGEVFQQETRSLQLPPDLPAYTPIEVHVSRDSTGQVDIGCQIHIAAGR